MLHVIKYPNAYGKDVILKFFETKPAARGFKLRLDKLLENQMSVIEDMEEDTKCPRCDRYIVDIVRNGLMHECEGD